MKVWVIKHKGADWWGNYLHSIEVTIGDEKIYADKFFYRKKDAQKYLEAQGYKEFYEVVGKE